MTFWIVNKLPNLQTVTNLKAPDGWKPGRKQLGESINIALKIFLESVARQTQVQGQF